MATTKFKFAINNAEFPFLYSQASRSVVQPGSDIAPRVGAGFTGGASYDYNVAQLLFCENVLPSGAGLVSVGYREAGAAVSPAVTDFDQLIVLRDSQERNHLMSPARGKNYVFDTATATWTSYNSFTWDSTKTLVSRAYVNGRTLVMYERDRVIEWDSVTPKFDTRTLTLPGGYAITDIRGICGASNYLVAHTSTEILWSTLTNILDLADLTAGAGRQTPIDLKGQITCLLPISGGFLICTTQNVVAAFFTGTAATPFSYREVTGSAGVPGAEQVTFEANQDRFFAYGTSGVQALSLQRAEVLLPKCTDFLVGTSYDSWDETLGIVVESVATGALAVKLQLLSHRYLCISYLKSGNHFQFVLVYDLALQRWGKLKIPHTDIGILPSVAGSAFDLSYDELGAVYDSYDVAYQDLKTVAGGFLPAKTGFLFLQESGLLQLLVTDPTLSSATGVALFGRIQHVRGRTVTFLGAQFDGLYGTPAPTVRLVGSTPGNGFDRDRVVAATFTSGTERSLKYAGRQVFENFDLAISGKFQLSNGVVEIMNHGSR